MQVQAAVNGVPGGGLVCSWQEAVLIGIPAQSEPIYHRSNRQQAQPHPGRKGARRQAGHERIAPGGAA